MRNIMNLIAVCMIVTSCSKTETTKPHAYVEVEDVVSVTDVEVWTQTEPTVVVADVVTCVEPPDVCKTDDQLTDFYLPVSFYDDVTDGSNGVTVVLPGVDVVDPLSRPGPEFPDVQ